MTGKASRRLFGATGTVILLASILSLSSVAGFAWAAPNVGTGPTIVNNQGSSPTTDSATLSNSNTTSSAGVMVPLYSYPGSDWNVVIKAKLAHPTVPMVAIINPYNGPGSSYDPNYASGVDNLRAAGVVVLGYDRTSYGARSTADGIADINAYKSWYAVNGIFFDEMANVPGYEGYYSSLNSYAKSVGFAFTVGNPGASTVSSYIGTVGRIVTYESEGVPDSSSLAAWTLGLPRNNFVMMAYGVSHLSNSSLAAASDYVSYVYVTDEGLPNPYGGLPLYFSKLVATLDASSLDSQPQLPISLAVGSVQTSGLAATIQVSYKNCLNTAVHAVVYAVARNSAGQTTSYAAMTASLAGGQTATSAITLVGLPSGAYSVEVFAVSPDGVAASGVATSPAWVSMSPVNLL
ncbi:MAG: spherulation-specific family 4 protein [Thaumarchaeota archaeon]|nr:spherulation-specific family 4 protein [Nitrososphaerota archaeon]